MMREHYLLRERPENEEPADKETIIRRRITQAVIGLVALTALTFIVVYFINYRENRPKNEIELIFEKGFIEYLKK